MYFFAKTDIGNNRSNNEDCFGAFAKQGLWILADGMGGHEAGEVASEIAVQHTMQQIAGGAKAEKAIQSTHDKIIESGNNGHGASGMGSTIVTLQMLADRYKISWVGDSRAYLWKESKNPSLTQLTTDHSYVQSLYEAGTITLAEIETHPEKHIITQCLGSLESDTPRVDSVEGSWKEEDTILMCSDGLSDVLSDVDIATVIHRSRGLKQAVDALIDTALKAGANDNITVVMVKHPTTWEKFKTNVFGV